VNRSTKDATMSTVSVDPFKEFKQRQREGWKYFAPLEVVTTPVAAHLVRFAGVKPGQAVLDVGTGTGVVAITARRAGARVSGLDLTPELLERAHENAAIAEVNDIDWKEGDVESLPYGDASFDVVLSQFGHMFAPRPEVATNEMLRVLKPGGRIAFATWPPDFFIGRMFAMVSQYLPPPPGVSFPGQWGETAIIRERLGDRVRDLVSAAGTMPFPCLSPQHYRVVIEKTAGPVITLVDKLAGEPAKLSEFRQEIMALADQYLVDNAVKQDYLLTRATKK
jgi:SAM-dependent methyltransferase